MINEPENSNQWVPCPPGELVALRKRLRWRRRDRIAAKAVGFVGIAVVLLVVGGLAVQQFSGPQLGTQYYGDISCNEVQANLKLYAAGHLDESSATKIRIHLEECSECGPAFRRMMAGQNDQLSTRSDSGTYSLCACGHCPPRGTTEESHAHTRRVTAVAIPVLALR